MPERQTQSTPDGWFRGTFDLIVATTFLSVIGCLFVAFAVLMGKYELLVLAYVLLGAACIRSLLSPEKRKELERVAVVGEGLRIFNRLESYYLRQPPRSILYYLFFPITGIWSFFFAKERGRQELKAYWGLLQWIMVLLVVGGFASYARFYQQFDWRFTLTWLYMELLAIYFLCNFFAVPLSTTSLRLSLGQKRIRLFTTTFLSLLILSGFLYVFAYRNNYENLIPINIMLDKRLAEFKARVLTPQGPKPLHKALLQYEEKQPYFDRILRTTHVFVEQHAPRILQFNQQYLLAPDPQVRQEFFAQLNGRYQKRLAAIATMDEHKQFFLTLTQTPKSFWVLVCIPFRESAFYFFRYKHKRLRLFKSWSSIPLRERARLLVSWDSNAFVFSQDKRMAQLVVEFMRDKFQRAAENLDRLAPKQQAPLTQEPQVAQSKSDNTASSDPASGKGRADRGNRRRSGRKEMHRGQTAQPPAMAPSDALPAPPSPPQMPSSKAGENKSTSSAPQVSRPMPQRRAGRRKRKNRDRKRLRQLRAIGGTKLKPGADAPVLPPIQWRKPTDGGNARDTDGSSDQAQGLRNAMARLEHDFAWFRRYLEREFGLASPGRHPTQGEALLAIWPKPWVLNGVPSFSLYWRTVITKELPNYRKALTSDAQAGTTWRPPPQPEPKNLQEQLQRLRQEIAAKRARYRRSRSIYTWTQIRKLKEQLLMLQEKEKAQKLRAQELHQAQPTPPPGTNKPQVSANPALLAAYTKAVHQYRHHLHRTRIALIQQWKQARHNRRHFSVHSPTLAAFDYPRALSARLLYDHFGKTPALVQTWWTQFYEIFLGIVMLLFQLTMPLHILMILYCQLRIADLIPTIEAEEQAEPLVATNA